MNENLRKVVDRLKRKYNEFRENAQAMLEVMPVILAAIDNLCSFMGLRFPETRIRSGLAMQDMQITLNLYEELLNLLSQICDDERFREVDKGIGHLLSEFLIEEQEAEE